jgi:hypothetical protein
MTQISHTAPTGTASHAAPTAPSADAAATGTAVRPTPSTAPSPSPP